MGKITFQSIFNAAWQAFIVEKRPPASDSGGCKYFMPDGRRCGVGWSLPEEIQEHPDFLNYEGFHQLVFRFPDLFDDQIKQTSQPRLYRFQADLHDHLCTTAESRWNYPPEEMERKYRVVADKFGLTIPDKNNTQIAVAHGIGSPEEYLSIALSPCL